MASMDLKVELPAHSHSFQIQVGSSWSIQEVKEEIRRTCPGAPRVDGQRVIWRGRFLKDDEKVQDVWRSPNEARIVHLSVHPSAWTGAPPSQVQSREAPAAPAQPQPQLRETNSRREQPPPQAPYTIPAYPPYFAPSGRVRLSYIAIKHSIALYALVNGRLPITASEPSMPLHNLKTQDTSLLAAYGWSYPTALDLDYPSPSAPGEGAKYEQVTLDGQPYLSLTIPTATPTPFQLHALNVLSHTYPLLPIVLPDAPIPPTYPSPLPSTVNPSAINLNHRLQQLGLPPLRVNQNPNDQNNPVVVAEIRAIPFRALMMPLMMLAFRTLLLMYFFSPSKRPLFGLILSAWILYEAWSALRHVLGGERAGVAGAQNGQGQGQAGDPQAAAGAGLNQQGRAGGQGPTTPNFNNRNQGPLDSILDSLANMNLSSEEVILDSDQPHPPPSLLHKAKSFVGLFVMSLHPAMWDRRRAVLRRREGRLRTEGNAREIANPSEGEGISEEDSNRSQARAQLVARHMRRQRWVREYVDRVQVTEWVDDP